MFFLPAKNKYIPGKPGNTGLVSPDNHGKKRPQGFNLKLGAGRLCVYSLNIYRRAHFLPYFTSILSSTVTASIVSP
jgi:hypothetical protein